ncbi:hypothetical protein RESH_05797 [Rhodopirellula europaea SH398]|jgi:hypothetical protein|uniref:Uncharacterized protein n=1 Tax=Rhodopirellula europaea SH398 TaxID=1263868 RepID=M5RX06_9BACT|nr:hypothetical protein RESH_05797 [Rhodopirellula europaea SH398]
MRYDRSLGTPARDSLHRVLDTRARGDLDGQECPSYVAANHGWLSHPKMISNVKSLAR